MVRILLRVDIVFYFWKYSYDWFGILNIIFICVYRINVRLFLFFCYISFRIKVLGLGEMIRLVEFGLRVSIYFCIFREYDGFCRFWVLWFILVVGFECFRNLYNGCLFSVRYWVV